MILLLELTLLLMVHLPIRVQEKMNQFHPPPLEFVISPELIIENKVPKSS